jgi:two-component system chemotaxis response regulator CheY
MPYAAILQVMVVDDQRAMRALVRASLAELGCRDVVECADGEEALAEIKARPPHLVISDMNMPRLDGLGLLKAMKADARWRAIRFIMLTSRTEIELVREAKTLGVDNYLVKPFSLTTIRQKIEAVLGPLT